MQSRVEGAFGEEHLSEAPSGPRPRRCGDPAPAEAESCLGREPGVGDAARTEVGAGDPRVVNRLGLQGDVVSC